MNISAQVKKNIYFILSYHWDQAVKILELKVIKKLINRVWEIANDNNKQLRLPIEEEDETIENINLRSEHLFLTIINVLDERFRFDKFIPILLDPSLFKNKKEFRSVYSDINSELDKTEYSLSIESINDDRFQIFEVVKKKYRAEIPKGVSKNDIPFYLYDAPKDTNDESEYFVLDPNLGWNDFSVITIFDLRYYKNGKRVSFGRTKIMHRIETETYRLIPDKFLELEGTFCSLSSNEEFYTDLLDYFGIDKAISILYAIQDAGYFLEIQENFEYTANYLNSLIRTDSGERMARKARQILLGQDRDNPYSFTYNFTPNYSEDTIQVNLNFNNLGPIPQRIFAVIGKNGTGKTQLLTKLPFDLAYGDDDKFNSNKPAFSKIIALSFSAFDNFEIPETSSRLNYIYSGLKQSDGQLQSGNSRLKNFYDNWEKIIVHDRVGSWRSFLGSFISEDIINQILPLSNRGKYHKIDLNFDVIEAKLSSGQSILLNIVTEIVANIRYDSLIIYDEPETHLHPNAITELMRMLYELVEDFDSYCLIATHSPFIVRELFSKNVFILEKFDTIPSIRRIGIESFGENIGVLTDEVFGDINAKKPYRGIISNLVKDGNNFDEIVELLEFDDTPLSLNTKLFIHSLIDNKR
ncbi:AAA family ATPase [Sphingobacterium siyangense]|uniref:AAA family ATPase n=1 Tax=Sphingobacterium siyangense TaxID=459529 RepID=UPI002FDA8BF1